MKPDRAAPAWPTRGLILGLLAPLLAIFVLAGGEVARGARDLERERVVKATAAEIREYRVQRHRLPASLFEMHGPEPSSDFVAGYVPRDQNTFELRIWFERARTERESRLVGSAYAHPGGLVTYVFDVRRFDGATGADALDPVAVNPVTAGTVLR